MPKNFPLMDELLEELSDEHGVYDMEKWIPKIIFLLLFRNLSGLIKAVNEEHITLNGMNDSWTAGLQAILALGAIGNGKAIKTLIEISSWEFSCCADYPSIANAVLEAISNEDK